MIKTTLALFFLGLVALASAQLADLSLLPSCAITSCLLPAFTGSGCQLTDLTCLCNNANFRNTLLTCLPANCPSQTDRQIYQTTINSQCTGLRGYPISIVNAPISPPNSNQRPSSQGVPGGQQSQSQQQAPSREANGARSRTGPDNLLAFTVSIFGGAYLFATLWV